MGKINAITSKINQVLPDFKQFGEFVLENQKEISPRFFSRQFGLIQRDYLSANQRDLFLKEADRLASTMVESKNEDFAGIIYSALTKVSEFLPKELEVFAKKGLKVAESKGDYVHIMARLNNLRKIYSGNPEKLYDYVQVLYAQEKCLKKLSHSYESATSSFRTVSRRAASQQDYEKMLAFVQTEIGKLTWRKHPNDALKKLESARRIFANRRMDNSTGYIDMLIDKIHRLPSIDVTL